MYNNYTCISYIPIVVSDIHVHLYSLKHEARESNAINWILS